MLNWEAMQRIARPSIKDVHCEQALMVVRGFEESAGPVEYRCPLMPQVVLGRYTGMPIFAWPAYAEGSSEELGAAIRKLNDEASTDVAQHGK